MMPTILSRVFDPFVMLSSVFMLIFWDSPKVIPAFSLMVLLPILLFILAWRTKVVSNWDVSDRRQRPKVLWVLFGIEVLSVILLKIYAAVPVLIALFFFTVVTHFWKISGHALGVGLLSGEVIVRFGWSWWPLLLIVPFVCWARVVRRDHTVLQVTAGALVAWGTLWVCRVFV